MTALLVFAVVLLAAVLVSEYASRSILSTSVLFLVAGFVAGGGVLGWVEVEASSPTFELLAELALFSVLFSDGMEADVQDLRTAWRLPGAALLLGMPLTFGLTAVLAHGLAGLGWPSAFLVGAALTPTDPVFASAVVKRPEVPRRLRRLLNVESGLNDGLALPIVLVMLAVIGTQDVSGLQLLRDIALGIAIGVAVPWVAVHLERRETFEAVQVYEPLFAFSIGLIVYAITAATHANEFLAAFAAGATVASMSEQAEREFHEFGDIIVELFKLATLLLFGALIAPRFFADLSLLDYLFVLLVLIAVRPAAIGIAFLRGSLDWRQWIAAAWFGPKGFASVVYALLILKSGVAQANDLYHLIAAVIAASIVAHSSTDVLLAQWFARHREADEKKLERAAEAEVGVAEDEETGREEVAREEDER